VVHDEGGADTAEIVRGDARNRIMKRSRVLLADDHVLILEGLRKILEPYHEVVGET
jgi:PleD family two-component response regulator